MIVVYAEATGGARSGAMAPISRGTDNHNYAEYNNKANTQMLLKGHCNNPFKKRSYVWRTRCLLLAQLLSHKRAGVNPAASQTHTHLNHTSSALPLHAQHCSRCTLKLSDAF